LGAVKILFPNIYSVYIHDTPTKYLFESDYRSHSHGCIRCQDPLEVSALLMSLDTFIINYDSLVRLKEQKVATKNFNFKKPIPVYLQYYTAESDWNGKLRFYIDVYQKDSAMIATIFSKPNSQQTPKLINAKDSLSAQHATNSKNNDNAQKEFSAEILNPEQ
jgi:murein L,D-transpeptidase YcbB/YkuD